MNIIPYIHDKFSLFGMDEEFVILSIVSPEFRALSNEYQGAYVQAFRFLSEDTSEYDLDTLRDFVAKPMIDQTNDPEIYIAHQGEDFCLKVHLNETDDFTGYNLVARIAETHEAISALTIAGDSYANAPVQQIPIIDLDKLEGRFYRVHITLEHVEAGAANGDAVSLLSEVLLIVREMVDSDE